MPSVRLLSPALTIEKHSIQRRLIRRAVTCVAALAVAVVLSPNACAARNPVPFVDSVSPVKIMPGSTGNTLTVRGTGFVASSTVLWNSTALTTTFVSAIELTAAVPDSFVAAVGLGSVIVSSPGLGGGKSGATFIPVAVAQTSTMFPAAPTSSFNVGNSPMGIVTADFNGDGKMDLAVANDAGGVAGTVSILLGDGHGNFTTQSTPTAGDGPYWLAVGDFNEDGVPDLAVANNGSNGTAGVTILLQDVSNGVGTGNFIPKSPSPSIGNGPFAVIAGDFNGDGHLDLAVSNSNDGTISILLGNGDGTFSNGGILVVGTNTSSMPNQLVAGDFNGDGNLDLAVTLDNESSVAVLLGNGDGTFQSQATYSTGGGMQNPLGLIATDLTKTGALDLLAVNLTNVAILLHNGGGRGNGTFTLQSSPPTAGSVLIAGVVGDFNGDGNLDLAVSDTSLGESFLFLGNGDGTFGSATTYTTAAGSFGVATADFNGDGALDLAIANSSVNTVSIFLQKLPVELNPTSLTFASQAVSSTSAAQPIVLTNSTGSTLFFTSFGFTGANSADFGRTNNCGASIANNATCTIDVTFTPSASGSRVATLVIADSAANGSQTLALNGTGAGSAASITSATSASFHTGVSGSFAVTTSGSPTPTLSQTGSLPSGVTFTDNGNGTATLAGTPANGTDGVYTITITAHNGIGSDATQSFTPTVANPPVITKSFGGATVARNASTSLTFNVSNPNSNIALTGIAFTDTLPAGLVVSTPNNLSSTCTGTRTAATGSSTASLSAASLGAGVSCTVSLNVTGTTTGLKNNSVQVTSNEGGTGNTSNASITVVAPPVLVENFNHPSIAVGGVAMLAFTVLNGNAATSLTGIGFTDPLPAGLIIATPNGISGTCGGGTITATQATNVVSLSDATLAQMSSCVFALNVLGAVAGQQNNPTGTITSIEGGTGSSASNSINVVGAPVLAQAFSPTSVVLNGTSSLAFTLTNPAANTVAEAGVAFSDTLPAGLVVATPNGLSTTCGGTAAAVAGSTSISLTAGSIATSGSCIFVVNITGATSGAHNNVSGAVSSTNGATGNTSSATVTVASPPSTAQAFGAATMPLNGTTSLTLTLSNPNPAFALTGLAFTDNLPAGLWVATPNNLASTCSGAASAVAGSSAVTLSSGTIAVSASCTVSFNVTGATAGLKNNSVQASATEGGSGNPSNASITVVSPPVIAKAFAAGSIALGSSTSLSFTIQNSNATSSLSGIALSDPLPLGLVVSSPNGLSGSCGGGMITAAQATGIVSLSGAALAQSGSCVFSVNVTGTAAGQQNNTTGAATSTEGGAGNTASANLVVVAPPAIAEAFAPATVVLNGTSTLTFTLGNPAANTVALAAVNFSDALPAGVIVGNPNGLSNTCGGTPSAFAGTSTVSLTAGSIPTGGSCTLAINVTGNASGVHVNTSGAVSSTNGGTGSTASATLTVAAAPVIAQAFGAPAIAQGDSTSLTFKISNPNATVAFTGIAFADSLPAGLVVATPNNLASTCSGTATATAGSSSVSLTAGTLSVSSSCTYSLNVTGSTAGVKDNSVQVSSTEGGIGNTSNGSITVAAPPVLSEAFGAASIPQGGSASLSFTVQNTNATFSLSGIAFSDALPAGLVIATPSALSGSCGGGTIAAVQATAIISLSRAALASSSSCVFSLTVTGLSAGTQNNTTGPIASANGGTGSSASASMMVVSPPAIAQAFGASTIALGASTTLTFTITNPSGNSATQTGLAFSDTLPAGLVVATPNGLTNTCSGTASAAAGFTTINLTAGSVAADASCTVVVNVTGTASGQYTDASGAVFSTNGGLGSTSSASLTVADPPAIRMVFGASSIALGASTALNFTITNPNSAVAMAGVAFTDYLPSGLAVSTPNGLNGTCGSGAIVATAGSQSIALSGGTVGARASCAFSIQVTAVAAGNQVNTTGNVSVMNGGNGNTATASIDVPAPDLTLTKCHAGNFFQGQIGAGYTLTVNNIGAGPSLGAVTVTDTLPAGLTATAMGGMSWNCNLATVTCMRSDALAAAASYAPILLTVSVAANAAFGVTNNAAVSGGGELNLSNDTASDFTTITLPPDFTVSTNLATDTIRAGQSANFSFTITPVINNFTNPITFTVSGLPPGSTFIFNPSTVTPGSSLAATSLVVVTTQGDPYVTKSNGWRRNRAPLYAMLLPFAGLLLSGLGFRGRRPKSGWLLVTLLLVCVGLGIYGCTGARTNFQYLGTPAGTYPITITGTSGGLQHSMSVTLIVQR